MHPTSYGGQAPGNRRGAPSAAEAGEAIAAGRSPVELTEAYLDRIAERDSTLCA